MVVHPPAKLNLYLDVLFRRDDGFHELETVMHAIDLVDRLTVRRISGDAIRFVTRGRPSPAGPDNLVVRAAEAFFSSQRSRFGVEAELKKNIPLGAGLGGGSADAAGMLVALDHLTESPLGPERLRAIAGGLGSDVPFFVESDHSPTAVASGRGEVITPFGRGSSPRFTFVVFYPGTNVLTASVYRHLNLDLTRPKNDLKTACQTMAFGGSDRVPEFYNSLAEPFRGLHPGLAALQDRASEVTARPFSITGSGSAMFTVVADRNEGERVREDLRALGVGETFVCTSLPERPDDEGGGKP